MQNKEIYLENVDFKVAPVVLRHLKMSDFYLNS